MGDHCLVKSLREVCRRILDFCLELGKGEKMLILFDRTSRELAPSFEEEANRLKAISQLCELPYGEKTASFPESVLTMAKSLSEEDAVIVLSSGSMIHYLSIHKVVSPFSRLRSIRSRSLYIPPFPKESLVRIISVDFDEYECYQDKLLRAFDRIQTARLFTNAGTNIAFRVRKFGFTPYRAIFPGEHALFHLGEIWTAIIEDSAEGVLLYDTCLAGGKIQSKLVLHVSGGRAFGETIVGKPDPVIEEYLKSLRGADENARIVGELGIGLNPNAKISGCIMEDESVRGTCHIDLGDNRSLGGLSKSDFHAGGVMMYPTIEADGRPVLVEGVFKSFH